MDCARATIYQFTAVHWGNAINISILEEIGSPLGNSYFLVFRCFVVFRMIPALQSH
jgi:hypothetical protein